MADEQDAVSHFATETGQSIRDEDIANCTETRNFIRDNYPLADFQRDSENLDEAWAAFSTRIAIGHFPDYPPHPVLDARIAAGLLTVIRTPGVGGFLGRAENACIWAANEKTSIEAAALFYRLFLKLRLDEDELRAFGQLVKTDAYKRLLDRVGAYVPV